MRKKNENEKKSNSNNNSFLTFTFLYRKIYVLLENIFGKLNLYCCICITVFRVTAYEKCSNKTPKPMQICTGLVVAVLRPKILGNRLGILT